MPCPTAAVSSRRRSGLRFFLGAAEAMPNVGSAGSRCRVADSLADDPAAVVGNRCTSVQQYAGTTVLWLSSGRSVAGLEPSDDSRGGGSCWGEEREPSCCAGRPASWPTGLGGWTFSSFSFKSECIASRLWEGAGLREMLTSEGKDVVWAVMLSGRCRWNPRQTALTDVTVAPLYGRRNHRSAFLCRFG